MNMLLLLIFGPALLYLAISLPLALAGGLLRGSMRGLQAWRGSRRGPMLSEPELNLRRASRAAGCIAVLLLAAVFYGDAGPLALLFAGVVVLCLVQIIIGLVGCWGLRKRELAVASGAWLVFGIGLLLYLALHFPLLRLRLDDWQVIAAQAGFGTGIWCLVTGALRLLVLTLGGGGGALRRILRHIGRRVGSLRPARPRSY
jgi:hypothetical protein